MCALSTQCVEIGLRHRMKPVENTLQALYLVAEYWRDALLTRG